MLPSSRSATTFLIMCAEAIAPDLAREQSTCGRGRRRRHESSRTCARWAVVRSPWSTPSSVLIAGTPKRVLDGIARASELFGVPVVGGHLTVGEPAAVSAACTGTARVPLHASAARPGDALLVAMCTEGAYVGDAPFFSSLRTRDPELLRSDGEVLAVLAERGSDPRVPRHLDAGGRRLAAPDARTCRVRCAAGGRPPAPTRRRRARSLAGDVSELRVHHGGATRNGARCHRRVCGPSRSPARTAASSRTGRSLVLSDGAVRREVWDLAREPLTATGISSA